MIKYRIYTTGNYLLIEDNNTHETQRGFKKEVFIDKSNARVPAYRFFNVKDWESKNSLKIEQILKQDGSPYTQNEWETFYTENTGNFNAGAVVAPQILDALNNATSPSGSNPFATISDLGVKDIDSVVVNPDGTLTISFTDGNNNTQSITTVKSVREIKYTVSTYADLFTVAPPPQPFDFAYVRQPQGTEWLPGSMGGTYYGAGLYMWDGVTWKEDKISIYQELDSILDTKADITYVDQELTLKENLSTGYISGLELSIHPTDNTKAVIKVGKYVITDIPNSQANYIEVTTPIVFTPAYLNTSPSTYVALDVNKNVVSSAVPFDNADRRFLCLIGNVVHSNNVNINVVNEIKSPITATTNQLHDFLKAIGFLNLEGNVFSANGANLSINKSAGKIFGLGINGGDYSDPHRLTLPQLIAPAFRYRLSNSVEFANTTVLDPTYYESAPGVLTPLTNNNKWSIQRINIFQSGIARVQPGQHEYNSFVEARNSVFTESFTTEQNIASNAVFRCYLILKKTCTDLQADINAGIAEFVHVGKFGNAISGSGASLTLANILTALGYTPENIANKQDSLAVDGTGTKYPTVDAVLDYISNLALGLIWQESVQAINVIGNSNTPITGNIGEAYIVDSGGNTGIWSAFQPGDLIEKQSGGWVLLKSLVVGDRIGCDFKNTATPINSFATKANNLVKVTGGVAGNFIYTFTQPQNNFSVFVSNVLATPHSVSFTYSTNLNKWVQISAEADLVLDSNFTVSGNSIALNPVNTRLTLAINNVDNTSDLNKPISTATQNALNNKSDITHTHNATAIVGLDEFVEDTIGTKIVAGSNISVSYNDTTGNTIINATTGESNTASNVGVGGVGIFRQKTGANLEFKNINSASNKIVVTNDTINSEVDIDVNEANFTNIPQSAITGLGSLATQSSVNLSTQATGTLQAGQFPALTGEVTNTVGSLATTVSNSAVTGKVLTGLPISVASIGATDSILTAFGKVQGQLNNLNANSLFQNGNTYPTDVVVGTNNPFGLSFKTDNIIRASISNTGTVTVNSLAGVSNRLVEVSAGGVLSATTPMSAVLTSTTGDWTGTFDGQEGSFYLNRANHTGTQVASTISDFNTAVASTALVKSNNLADVTNTASARNNILPSKTGNSLKVLRVNLTETDYELVPIPTSTNLTTVQTATDVTINSDTGTDALIPLANGVNAGVSLNNFTTAEKNKLSGLNTLIELGSGYTTTSTTRGNIPELTFNMVAGGVYEITLYLNFQTVATTTGVSIGFITPAGTATITGNIMFTVTQAIANSELHQPIYAINSVNTTAGSFATSTGVGTANAVHTGLFTGILKCSANGTFQVQLGSEVAGSQVQLNQISTMKVTKLN